MERGRVFDAVAGAYDAQRSGYPSKLFADVVALGGLKPGSRVLEIGCGSGLATAGFLAEGLDVTGVDPGASLIEIAHQKFSESQSVCFEVETFEHWQPKGRKFQLVAAAQSWHWVRADIGFAKAADMMLPGGGVAIFGHTPTWSAELIDCLKPAYSRFAPGLWGPPPEAWYLPSGPIRHLIRESGRSALSNTASTPGVVATRRRRSPLISARDPITSCCQRPAGQIFWRKWRKVFRPSSRPTGSRTSILR